MRALQAAVEPQEVQDYVLAGWDGPVRLSELFGDKRDLIVIHNMGDRLSGLHHVGGRLQRRLRPPRQPAPRSCVASPNPVAAQKKFAASRGWRFPMVSYEGSSFAEDMGYREGGDALDEKLGGWNPGVSDLPPRGRDASWRLSDAEFGPWRRLLRRLPPVRPVPGRRADLAPALQLRLRRTQMTYAETHGALKAKREQIDGAARRDARAAGQRSSRSR